MKAKNPARLVSAPITDAPAHVAAGDAAFPRLDFWSVQVYRGTTFGTFFADYAARSARPLVITEFGIDAFNHSAGAEYPDRAAFTADVLASLWRELLVASAVASGGCVFEFSDEWGKVAAPLAHDAGGFAFPAWPDGWMDEEWWGLFAATKNASGPDTLAPRAAVGRLREIFTAPPIGLRVPPAPVTVAPGGSATFRVEAVSPLRLAYQWRRDGVAIPGAAGDTLALAGVSASDAADYDVVVSGGAGGAIVSAPARLTVATPVPSRLVGLSVRGPAGTGSATLIAGLAVTGAGTLDVLARGVGPTLADYGVGGVLANPRLEVFAGNVSVGANDDWWTTDAANLRATAATLGAFPLAEGGRDAALLVSLNGTRTVHLTGVGGAGGVALAEIYAVSVPGAARLAGISARNVSGAGSDVLTAGFVIEGNTPVTLLIRGVGPALAGYGVSGAMADPVVKVFDAARREVVRNDNWADALDADLVAAAAAQVGDFALPVGRDAALLRTLPAGLYTVQVGAADGATSGVALIEVYEVR